jgi:DNA invertase Pin-like site-specific DNA recombinase
MTNYVTYYRVSTDKQGKSGLGLEAQRAQVAGFIAARPGQVIGDFQEIETGKNDRRPQLSAALKQAKDSGATLLIAKIDRLSRNAGFIFNLKDSGVDFVAVDMPDANTLTVGIMALLAQQEREMISSRTKAALQAKKAQGARLGAALVGCNFTAAGRRKSALVRRAEGLRRTETARSIAKDLRGEGRTLAEIAERLNKYELKAPRGGLWGAKQVSRIL